MKTSAPVVLLSLVLAAAVAGCSAERSAAPVKAVEAMPAPDAHTGRTIAERDCRRCHGLDGAGLVAGTPRLDGQREAYLLHALQEYGAGKRAHASVSTLPQVEQRHVAAYYGSLPGRLPQPRSEVAPPIHDAAACTTCHGADGNARTPGTPSLAGQQPFYLVAAMHQYRDGDRLSKPMNAIAVSLDEARLKSLSGFFASQRAVPRKPGRPAEVEAGRIASAACAVCHGVDGVSEDAAVPNLAGQDAAFLANRINAYRGKSGHWGMPQRVLELSEQDARHLAAFYATQTPRPPGARDGWLQAMAAQCGRCHDGDNGAVPTPALDGQDRAYLASVLREYRSGTRASSPMHKMTAMYSDVAIDGIASWYAASSD